MEAEQVDADVIALARGPHKVVSTYDGFIVNGFRVHTKKHEQHCKNQNNDVMVFADGRNYYERFWAIMLGCDWVNIKSPKSMKNDANGFIMVKFSELIHIGNRDLNDPYILASQAKQEKFDLQGKVEDSDILSYVGKLQKEFKSTLKTRYYREMVQEGRPVE
ncbi:hypothetical protein PVK06_019885 [Gossypium arboreum]|uniref:DUF4216 domain-containing protein n=1 Tax=Gossypium arboreum TaxID=29729 RepID=A0ABR0PKW5_GOSAR|nr:hypothetical protein PVK06_019885 [Gossypium arboreum]